MRSGDTSRANRERRSCSSTGEYYADDTKLRWNATALLGRAAGSIMLTHDEFAALLMKLGFAAFGLLPGRSFPREICPPPLHYC